MSWEGGGDAQRLAAAAIPGLEPTARTSVEQLAQLPLSSSQETCEAAEAERALCFFLPLAFPSLIGSSHWQDRIGVWEM